jgi:arsenate reductase-like glutaredoxin family protein
LDTHGIEVRETVPASRKLGKSDAAALVKGASVVFVAKGKKLDRFDGGKASAKTVAALLGPTGNLRSPTLRAGKTVVVGFNEESLAKVLL